MVRIIHDQKDVIVHQRLTLNRHVHGGGGHNGTLTSAFEAALPMIVLHLLQREKSRTVTSFTS